MKGDKAMFYPGFYRPVVGLVLTWLFALLFLSCNKNNDSPDPVFASASESVTPQQGGTIELSNRKGDIIELLIPSYALENTTSITVEVLNETEENPFKNNFLTTIRILPDGLRLDSAATLKIAFAESIPDTARALIYYLKKNDLAYPLKTKWTDKKTVEAKLYHFSDYGGANPSKQEIESQANKVANDFNYDILDWQGFYEYVNTMLKYIEYCFLFGDDEIAQPLINSLETRVVNQCNAFLDAQVPDEPCGYYLNALLKYHELFCMVVSSNVQLDARFQNRLNEVLNRCYIRGELDFDYNFSFEYSGAELCRHIEGTVPFKVNTTIDPYGQISGNGTLVWKGWMNGLPANCTYDETGIVEVTLDGEMVLDDSGILWMEFSIFEHASGTVSTMCDGIGTVKPFNPPDGTNNIRMLAEDGAEYSMPVQGANGSFRWVLHLIVR